MEPTKKITESSHHSNHSWLSENSAWLRHLESAEHLANPHNPWVFGSWFIVVLTYARVGWDFILWIANDVPKIMDSLQISKNKDLRSVKIPRFPLSLDEHQVNNYAKQTGCEYHPWKHPKGSWWRTQQILIPLRSLDLSAMRFTTMQEGFRRWIHITCWF